MELKHILYVKYKTTRGMSSKSLYDILNVTKNNTCTEIKKAYLKLARTHHPDKGGDQEKFNR